MWRRSKITKFNLEKFWAILLYFSFFTLLSTKSTFAVSINVKIIDQFGVNLPNAAVNIADIGIFDAPATVDIPVGSRDFTIYPIKTLPGQLSRLEIREVTSATTEIVFEWQTATFPVRVVDQNGVEIPGSGYRIIALTGSIATGTPITLPVTDENIYPNMQGTWVNGYPFTVYPIERLPGQLNRLQIREVTSATTEIVFEWIRAIGVIYIVDGSERMVPDSEVKVDFMGTFNNCDTVSIPITDESIYPTLSGDRKNGYYITLYPGDIVPQSATGQFEVSTNNQITPLFITISGKQYGIRVSAVCPIDTTPPETSITLAIDGDGNTVTNGGSTLSDSMMFFFTATDNCALDGFERSLDGGAFISCVSPLVIYDLAEGDHTFEVRAIDAATNVDSTPASFSWIILTAEEAASNIIDVVEDLIDSGVLNEGEGNSLETKLEGAIDKIEDGNTNAAVNKIGAFINQVEAMVNSGRLTEEEGQALIDAAQDIINELADDFDAEGSSVPTILLDGGFDTPDGKAVYDMVELRRARGSGCIVLKNIDFRGGGKLLLRDVTVDGLLTFDSVALNDDVAMSGTLVSRGAATQFLSATIDAPVVYCEWSNDSSVLFGGRIEAPVAFSQGVDRGSVWVQELTSPRGYGQVRVKNCELNGRIVVKGVSFEADLVLDGIILNDDLILEDGTLE